MIRVGVNGYGTIGRRVADAVKAQKDMELVGITKTKPDYRSSVAEAKGIGVYAVDMKCLQGFREAGAPVKGTLNDLLQRVDVMVDAAPAGTGEANRPAYEQAGVRVVYQGGAGEGAGEVHFVAQCNFEAAVGKKMVKVVSCNTTGLCRTIGAVDRSAGVSRARVVLARRAADPDDDKRGPIDAVVLDPTTLPSHHGADVEAVLKGVEVVTMAFKVPTTHMHLDSLILTLKKEATKEQLLKALSSAPRVVLVDGKDGFRSTASVVDWARDRGSSRGDLYEAVVWKDSVTVIGGEAYMFMAVHQEGIVVPENVDAIRAVSGGYSREESMKLTDESLGIPHRGP